MFGVLFNELNPSPFPQVRGKQYNYSLNITTFKTHISVFTAL